ncbi:MAG: alpha/beta fold hydrolase [Anaerolineales bacterium]
MKSWRYYRNLLLFYIVMFLMLATAARALTRPSYWILTLLLVVVYNAVRSAFAAAHPWRRLSLVPEERTEFRNVTFPSSDGLSLFGRFMAGRNRATIILVHGLGSSSRDLLLLGRLLVRAGFGVLLLDLRAHGSSQGDTSTLGLRESGDVLSAVQYLLTRIDVHGDRIGAYGVSLGAQAVLRAAIQTDKIHALVLEGLAPSRISDHGGVPKTVSQWISYPVKWMFYPLHWFMVGGRDAGLLQIVGKVAPRPILFIANGEKDIAYNRLFYKAAGEPKELWEVPEISQGGALAQEPDEFMKRMIDFFGTSLGVRQGR